MTHIQRTLALLFTAVLLTTTAAVQAQDPDGWDDNASQDTPVDGGLSLLIAAGAGYGIKKVRDARKQAK